MWWSVGAMLIPNVLLWLWLLLMIAELQGKNGFMAVGSSIVMTGFLVLFTVVLPILGLLGWFRGRGEAERRLSGASQP